MPETITNVTGSAAPADKIPAKKRLTFADDNGFYLELKRRVDLHMAKDGRRERDCPQMYLKTAIILTTFVTSYVLLVFVSSSSIAART